MKTVELPHRFVGRPYQNPFLYAMETEGKKRAVCVWHRRAGKDKTFLNFLIPRMIERVGAYYYYFPTAAMGRDILWDGMDRDSFKFTDHFPKELVKRRNESEMKIELTNGSIFKIRGTDKREPIGINPVGCVFSEYSRQSPSGGWDLVRPILAENGGWAVFNYTPRGKNHAYRLWRMAASNDNWFCQTLTVDDTHAISSEAIDDDRLSGMSEELIQQEYYCSFDIGAEGSYYGQAMSRLWANGHIKDDIYEPSAQVYTFWDLGIGDSTAIWFAQFIANEIRIIDYYEAAGMAISHYAQLLQEKPYIYAKHYAPHDVEARSLQTGQATKDIAKDLGIKFVTVSRQSLESGIEAVRSILPQKGIKGEWTQGKVWFDKAKCEHGIDCLENYHKEYIEKREDYSVKPCHDWSSHGADAFRYMAIAYRNQLVVNNIRIGVPRPLVNTHAFPNKSPYADWHVLG